MNRTTLLIALATLIGCVPSVKDSAPLAPAGDTDVASPVDNQDDLDAIEDDEAAVEDEAIDDGDEAIDDGDEAIDDEDEAIDDEDEAIDDDDMEDIDGDTGEMLDEPSIDVTPDAEPRQEFLFIPDSNHGPQSGFALYHADTLADGIDEFDNIAFESDFGDSGAAALELEVMLNCDGGANLHIVDVETFSSVLTAPCGHFQPVDGLLEDGGQYLAVVSIDEPGAVVAYELYMIISAMY